MLLSARTARLASPCDGKAMYAIPIEWPELLYTISISLSCIFGEREGGGGRERGGREREREREGEGERERERERERIKTTIIQNLH